jgi:quercetin dioxygenase-like cupin family protein
MPDNAAATEADRQLDFHPAMGERWEITRSTKDTSGEVFESTIWFDPRFPGPPPHLHPSSEESFEVIEGSFDVLKDGQWTTLRPGAAAAVPPGVPHTFRNGADETAKVVIRIRPAGRSEAFFRHMHKLIGEGKVKRLPPKEPRSAIYAVMLFNQYPDWTRPTGPMNGVFKALALVGKVLRFEL